MGSGIRPSTDYVDTTCSVISRRSWRGRRSPLVGKRDPQVDEAILDAAGDVLVEGGLARLTIDAVARRAAVARTTVYRRYPSVQHLATAVLTRITRRQQTAVRGDLHGDLHGDLVALLRAAYGELAPPRSVALAAALIGTAAGDPGFRSAVQDGWQQRRAWVRDALRPALDAAGIEIPDPELDLVLDMLSGLAYMRLLVRRQDLPPDAAEAAVRVVLPHLLGYARPCRGPGAGDAPG